MKNAVDHLPVKYKEGKYEYHSFDHFWAEYPTDRRVAKKKAATAFGRLSESKRHACLTGLITHRDHNPQWRDSKYIPHPATFINQERWSDPIAKPLKEKIAAASMESKDKFVWAAMVEFFGQAWINKHGDKPGELWRKLLADIEPYRIKRGLRRTFDSGMEHPPSLPKFAEYCARTFGEECERQEAAKDTVRLPSPTSIDFPCTGAADAFQQVFKILGVTNGQSNERSTDDHAGDISENSRTDERSDHPKGDPSG